MTADHISEIGSFYESRGATPRVFVTPAAHPSLEAGLAAAGYAPSERESILASDDRNAHAQPDGRIGVAKDIDAWARASAEAFLDRRLLAASDARIALILATAAGTLALEARDRGDIVATAAMDVRGECAGLFAGSTLPAFRRQGWHSALIADRIARARDAGARLLRATAKPGSASERNFHRHGFVTLYERVLWERVG